MNRTSLNQLSNHRACTEYERVLAEWPPMAMVIEDGMPAQELAVIAQAIAETLLEYKHVSVTDEIVFLLEEFIQQTLEEYDVLVDDAVVQEISRKLISVHNKAVRAE